MFSFQKHPRSSISIKRRASVFTPKTSFQHFFFILPCCAHVICANLFIFPFAVNPTSDIFVHFPLSFWQHAGSGTATKLDRGEPLFKWWPLSNIKIWMKQWFITHFPYADSQLRLFSTHTHAHTCKDALKARMSNQYTISPGCPLLEKLKSSVKTLQTPRANHKLCFCSQCHKKMLIRQAVEVDA